MNVFFACHVVTGQAMTLGQRIVLGDTYHNGVHHRVMEKLPLMEEIYASPEAFRGQEPEHHLSVALRELAMEQVRREEFPQYPSRLGCLYVSRDRQDSFLWAELFRGWGRDVRQIVKLRIRGQCFDSDANNCFPGTPDREENLKKARHYWKNLPNPQGERPIREMLVDGEIEVAEILKTFD